MFVGPVLTLFQYDYKQLIQLNVTQIYMVMEEIVQLIKLIQDYFHLNAFLHKRINDLKLTYMYHFVQIKNNN